VSATHVACLEAQVNSGQDAWPSSAAFDLIASALSTDAERKDAIKKGGAIFAFTLKNEQGEQQDWHIDLKETGTVGKGLAPEGKKPGGKLPALKPPHSYRRDILADTLCLSQPHSGRRPICKAYLWKGQCAEAVHERQAQGEGRCYEGDQDGAYFEEGPEQGQAIDAER
jgi:hypothetical protein